MEPSMPPTRANKTTTKTPPAPRLSHLSDGAALAREIAGREDAVRDRASALARSRSGFTDPTQVWLEAERGLYRRAPLRLVRAADGYRIDVELPGVAAGDVEVRI